MRKITVLVFSVGYFMLPGCVPVAPPLDCVQDNECGTKNPGICVFSEGLPGACGVPDETCPSGYRYYKNSSGGRSNLCAVLPTFELQITPSSVKEHEVFPLHAIVKDGNGQKLTTYKGAPEVSAEWGDAKVFSSSGFVNGEADYTLWLNRETNDVDGKERVVLKDGASIGRSQGVSVTAASWNPDVRGSAIELDNSVSIPTNFLFSHTVDYDFFYSDLNGQDKIYHATSIKPYSGKLAIPPDWNNRGVAFRVEQVPWKTSNINPSGIAAINGHFLMSYGTSSVNSQGAFVFDTGLAKSEDGLVWSNLSPTPLSSNPVDGDEQCAKIYGATIFSEKNILKIFYNSTSVSCRAESDDEGATWKNAKVMTDFGFITPVIKEGSVFRNHSGRSSRDGVIWSKTTTPSEAPGHKLWIEQLNKYVGITFNTKDKNIDVFTR